ncbi:MAG TPA: DUF465 domain-containing protein [Nitrospirae bacterium]|nr:DUF465 domain-containing protein [Nitrospirota bacterium]
MSVKTDDSVVTRLLDENEEYIQLNEEHMDLKSKVELLRQKKHLSPEEDYELAQLKKKKLAGKDRMEKIVFEARANM